MLSIPRYSHLGVKVSRSKRVTAVLLPTRRDGLSEQLLKYEIKDGES